METPTFLYEDEDLFVVYKPAGLHSVCNNHASGASLAEALLTHYPFLKSVAAKSGDAGLVQRLDRDTSGVILGAKNRDSWELLRKDLFTGAIKKSYVAYIEGFLERSIEITTYIGSRYRRSKKVTVIEERSPMGDRFLKGTSMFTPLKTNKGFSLVKIFASPARRHQIRAHAAYINHPLVGDALYGSKQALNDITIAKRDFFLHAAKLSFLHPKSGKQVAVSSPYESELLSPSFLD